MEHRENKAALVFPHFDPVRVQSETGPGVSHSGDVLYELLVAPAVRKAEEGAADFESHGRRVDGEGFGRVEVEGDDIGGEPEDHFLLGLALRFTLGLAVDVWFVLLKTAFGRE